MIHMRHTEETSSAGGGANQNIPQREGGEEGRRYNDRAVEGKEETLQLDMRERGG